MKNILLPVLLLSALTQITACKKDDEKDNPNKTQNCETSQLPLVMAHGALASGDTYILPFMRFSANGFCEDRMFVFDWNTLANDGKDTTRLHLFIDSVLRVTNASQVILVGHSAGGNLGYRFCSDPNRAAKVAKYIHIGSSPQTQKAGNGTIPTLNIWSPGDKVVAGADNPEAQNAKLDNKDHYEVATCAEAFSAMYQFITGKLPLTTEIVKSSSRKISGKVLTLGENKPIVGATVKVYEVNPSTGERITSNPVYTFSSVSGGFWGPIEAKENTHYEFEVNTQQTGDRIVHYYREPFPRNNPFVYLRTLPPASSTVGGILSTLPKNDNQAVQIVFSANKAVLNGRDVLKVNDSNIATPSFASETATSIAFFLYDGNNNQTSDFSPIGFFGTFPFLESVDIFFPTLPSAKTTFEFNGRKYAVNNWKSDSEGIGVVVFD
jgi:hypothetical protein